MRLLLFAFMFSVCVLKITYYCILNLIDDEKIIIDNGNTFYYGKHRKCSNTRRL